jgi:DNA mismatch endonuclease, patch repair protein
MKRVRQRGTEAELTVRRALTRLGASYRVNTATLPGSPDISNKSRKKAVFVHGCFWHGHLGCRRAQPPASNHKFWVPKIRETAARDKRKRDALIALGYDVLEVWECETRDDLALERRLAEFWGVR